MALYQEKFYQAQKELDELKSSNLKRDADSIARSAITFIHHKGLSQEWVDWIVKEIDERIKSPPTSKEHPE